MLRHNSTETADFDESVRLLRELHLLTLSGQDESEAAAAIREAMEAPWWKLDSREQQLFRGLSADLHSISVDRTTPAESPIDAANLFVRAVEACQWEQALNTLRKQEAVLPPADVAYLRGICWANLQQPEMATLFFAEAVRLRPDDVRFKSMNWRALIRAERGDEAKRYAEQAASTQIDRTMHITEYIRLFCNLHTRVARAEGSTANSNELREELDREELDYHWRNLTSEEVSLVDGLAIDLSRIGTDWASPAKIHIKLLHEFEELKHSKNWCQLLVFLRKHELLLPPADVFALRGICWAEFGQYTAATYFLGEAVRIKPDDLKLKGLFLSNMVRAENFDDARSRALAVAAGAPDPVALFLVADILFECAVATNDAPAANDLRQICDIAARGRAALEEPPRELWRRQLAFSGQLSQAMAYELLGDRLRALDAMRAARALAPTGVGNNSGSESWPDETTDAKQFRRVLGEKRDRSSNLSLSSVSCSAV